MSSYYSTAHVLASAPLNTVFNNEGIKSGGGEYAAKLKRKRKTRKKRKYTCSVRGTGAASLSPFLSYS